MIKLLLLLLLILPGTMPAVEFSKPQKPYIINHASLSGFDEISVNELSIASQVRMIFLHASIGSQITVGLDCIQGTRANPKECDLYPDYKYDRRNITFKGFTKGGFYGKVDQFDSLMRADADKYEVFSFKYCYLEGLDELQEPCGKGVDSKTVEKAFNYFKDKMNSLENDFPGKLVVWWTVPLTQVGQQCTDSLNRRIRDYALSNNKILFDIADIESHDTLGLPVRSADGLELAYKPYCGESQPGAQACHPSWLGKIVLGRNFWILMKDITSLADSGTDIIDEKDEYFGVITEGSQLRLSGSGKLMHSNVQIVDLTGITVFSQSNVEDITKLKITALQPGLYIVIVSGRAGCFTRKIIIY